MEKKNEEKAQEIALKYAREYLVSRNDSHKQNILFKESSIIECEKASLEAMELKDKQFEAEKQALIDKACEWLKTNMDNYYHHPFLGIRETSILNDLRKAMEE